MLDFSDKRGTARRTLHIAPAQGAHKQAPSDLLAEALAARFTALEEVRASDFSTIFLAEELEQGRLVQLEVLSGSAADDDAQVELFYHEAETAARLQHPHIIRAEAAAPIATTHFRVTEQVREAETLRELLACQGWLEPDRAVQIAAQIANALEYAHQMGALHLNLQPENILLDANGEVVVRGFGVAADKVSEWARRVRTRRGGAPYLSPEQISGQEGDRHSDLYALGVLLYEMLTDRVPFDSDDLDHLKRRQQTQVPQPPHNFRPELPHELSDLVLALLARNGEARALLFGSAASFSAALRQSCELQSVAAHDGTTARLTNPLPLSEMSAEVATADDPALALRRTDNEWLLRQIVGCVLRLEPLLSAVPARALVFPLLTFLLLWAAISTPQTGVPDSALKVKQVALANQSATAPNDGAPHNPQLGNPTQVPVAPASQAALTTLAWPLSAFPKVPGNRPTHSAFPNQAEEPAEAPELNVSQPPFSERREKQRGRFASIPNQRNNDASQVPVVVTVNEKGRVTDARALSGSATSRDKAERWARKLRFKPSRLVGAPVRAMKKFVWSPHF